MSNKITRVTPFIRPIPLQGGSFIACPSAAEDLSLSFNENPEQKFKFSKFALLNIPDISNEPLKNTIKPRAIAGAFNYVDFNRTSDWNNHFAESLQNYCLNLETAVLSKDNYDQSLPSTVSERVFFKWLKELSALRFITDTPSTSTETRYAEERDSDFYNKVVKYIGDIDFVNNFSGSVNSYSEVYLHIPTEAGDFSKVYFKSVEDANYYPGMGICSFNQGLNNEFLYGRKFDDSHPAGLDIHSFYDNDTGLGISNQDIQNGLRLYKQKIGKDDSNLTLCDGLNNCDIDYDADVWWYYPTSDTNCYYTEPITFNDSNNDNLAIHRRDSANPNLESTKFKRSRLDGIQIDFDPNSYKDVDQNIQYLIDVSRLSSSKDFEFNAILIYYDLYRSSSFITDDLEGIFDSQSGEGVLSNLYKPDVIATNLFGILFLDNVENSLSLDGGYIPRFKKCKPNSITNLNGNSYGFKLNLKLDVSPINSGVQVETFISDSNTLSMDIYANALNEMRKAMQAVQDVTFDNAKLVSRISEVEDYILSNKYTSLSDIQNKVLLLEDTILNDKNLEFAKAKSDILALVQQNYFILQDILSGKLDSKLVFDLDIIKSGTNIVLDKSSGKNIIVSSTNNDYNLGNIISTSIKNDWNVNETKYSYTIDLRTSRNYLRLEEPTLWTPNKNLELYINDNNVKWVNGQTFRIYLKQKYVLENQFGTFNFSIFTGKNLPQWKGILSLSAFDFKSYNNRPVIEIICIDEKNLNFIVDILN